MSGIRFAIIGGGWRAEFYLRIARALPERFQVGGMLVRDAEKGKAVERTWGVATYRTLDELLGKADVSFVVLSVPRTVSPILIGELAERGIPVLSETPPAPDVESLIHLHRFTERGAKIQVAEQYPFQPLHAARIAVAESGRLGTVSQAQVSAAHGYHGISLIRRLLGIGFENAAITAIQFTSPIVAGPTRKGVPTQETVKQSNQDIAWLDFNGKLAVFDFTGDQYFSWIRSPRLLVRGDRGEITNERVKYLKDFRTPVQLELNRVNAGEDGNLEGYYLKGIVAGEQWIYQNPFIPARLTDDEIAVATCLAKMDEYVKGGPSFYSLAEASQDHYLQLMIQQAVETGEKVTTTSQPWGLR